MTLTHRLISGGFAVAALASASVPALAWTVWPDVDFEWYAAVGKQPVTDTVEVFPAPRPGYIWSPAHYERTASGKQQWVAGQWVKDDYADQVAIYNNGHLADAPMTVYDTQGNVIPTNPDAYPIASSRQAPNTEASSMESDSSRR
jgi:hypothetical protein